MKLCYFYSIQKKYSFDIFRTFRILRGDKPYGFVIKGKCPVHVEWLDPEGPADVSGLLPGDFIVAINEIDARWVYH